MAGTTSVNDDWYTSVRDYTFRLVRIRSVSPGAGENAVAEEVLRLLGADGLEDAYTAIGLDAVEGDPFGRHNAYAYVRGNSARTVVLLGHIDTVQTGDYGPLEAHALDPDALAERLDDLVRLAPEVRADLEAHPGDWAFGRGVIDMKCGVAANIAVMRRLAALAREGRLPLSVLMLATPDEENESAGVLQGVRFLLRLKRERGLEYLGLINTDYTTALYPGDPHRYVYTGSIGKLLPSFFIVGRESHVGDPFDGVDANLILAEIVRDVSMCDDLCDVAGGRITPPAVTLHAQDLKAQYDVQLPFAAWFYLNVLTFTTEPGELLNRLCHRADASLARVLARLDDTERRWLRAAGDVERSRKVPPRSGRTITYDELRHAAERAAGADRVRQELDDEWSRWPPETDKRECSLHLVRRLWTLSGLQGPAVVVYYSPPFYPHVGAKEGPLLDAVRDVVARHPELNLVEEEYFQFLSDMSYLRLEPDIDVSALVANMPVWQAADEPPRSGAYSLPLREMRELSLPVANLGPYGKGAHQRGERALASYSFGVLPGLVFETVLRLGELAGHPG